MAETDRHVAVFAFPFGTHAAPLLAVVGRLAAASPAVHFSFFSTAQSNASLFPASQRDSQPNITVHDLPDGVPEHYLFTGKPQEHIELFMAVAPASFRRGVRAAEEETRRRVSCLLSDAFFWFAAEMAEEAGAAWVPFWAAGPSSLSAHVYTDLIRQKIGVAGIVGREDEPLEFIPGMCRLQIQDLPEGVVFGNMKSLFSCMLHKMGQTLPNATAILINAFEELDPIITSDLKSKFKKFLNIGPSNLMIPSSSLPLPLSTLTSWLDKQKPMSVTYVGFGSMITPPPIELVALAEALEASGVSFIWSLKENSKTHLPNGFLDKTRHRGLVVPWAPQQEVLAHGSVGVHVTHCGWNSVWESIVGGVPMICRPFYGDHRLNAGLVESVWGMGVRVEGGVFTKSGLMRSLELVLGCLEGKKMREKIKVLKQLAEEAVGPNGTSTENFRTLVEIVSA